MPRYFTNSCFERMMMAIPYPVDYNVPVYASDGKVCEGGSRTACKHREKRVMKLIITEKPSVAKSIASVIGCNVRKDGYIEGKDYVVSWCFGHLTELDSPDAYDERYSKWKLEDLPIMPKVFQYHVRKDVVKQFNVLKNLMHRKDVSCVINACDAGREGELIFRKVFELAECKKPMERLWISSMEDSAIRDGMADLKPGKDYDNLYAAAQCRSQADWLVGMNATRLFSVMYHHTLNAGRVISPTLAMVSRRTDEIANFKSEPFYIVELKFGENTAKTEKYKERTEAEQVMKACGSSATVTSVEKKAKVEKAPALYDLTALQRDANKKLGYTAKQTSDFLQELYEKKLVTYPRTDAKFLTDDMVDKVPMLVEIAAKVLGVEVPADIVSQQVCNSKKVSDHHALAPTVTAGRKVPDDLSSGEVAILNLICTRMVEAVAPPKPYNEVVVTLDAGGIAFTCKGKNLDVPGVVDGGSVAIDGLDVKDGKTTAPEQYTEDTLLAAMESAGKKELSGIAERSGIGTPATRADVLERLVNGGFVIRQKKGKKSNLVPTATGAALVKVLPDVLQQEALTVEWERKLYDVQEGNLDAKTFIREVEDMVERLVKEYVPVDNAEKLFPSAKKVVGVCPRCGGDVTESEKGFFCEKYSCKFAIWKDNKYLTPKRITLTTKMVKELLDKGRVPVKGVYSEKKNKTYDATLTMEDTGQFVRFGISFD